MMEECCVFHPDEKTRLSCAACGRPVCVDCVRHLSVGTRCSECAGERASISASEPVVRRPSNLIPGLFLGLILVLGMLSPPVMTIFCLTFSAVDQLRRRGRRAIPLCAAGFGYILTLGAAGTLLQQAGYPPESAQQLAGLDLRPRDAWLAIGTLATLTFAVWSFSLPALRELMLRERAYISVALMAASLSFATLTTLALGLLLYVAST